MRADLAARPAKPFKQAVPAPLSFPPPSADAGEANVAVMLRYRHVMMPAQVATGLGIIMRWVSFSRLPHCSCLNVRKAVPIPGMDWRTSPSQAERTSAPAVDWLAPRLGWTGASAEPATLDCLHPRSPSHRVPIAAVRLFRMQHRGGGDRIGSTAPFTEPWH